MKWDWSVISIVVSVISTALLFLVKWYTSRPSRPIAMPDAVDVFKGSVSSVTMSDGLYARYDLDLDEEILRRVAEAIDQPPARQSQSDSPGTVSDGDRRREHEKEAEHDKSPRVEERVRAAESAREALEFEAKRSDAEALRAQEIRRAAEALMAAERKAAEEHGGEAESLSERKNRENGRPARRQKEEGHRPQRSVRVGRDAVGNVVVSGDANTSRPEPPQAARPPKSSSVNGKAIMQGGLTVLVLVTALYVIVIKVDSDAGLKNWAYGVIGTLLGFWLKR